MSKNEELQRIADELQRTATTNDIDGLRRLFADDAILWHNFDDTAKPVDVALANLAGMQSVLVRSWQEESRTTYTDTGFVAQHYGCAELVNGDEVRVPVCVVVTVSDGLITRFDEYIEMGAIAPVLAALGAAGADVTA
ncbi:MAG TPA: nuclear transport factor 2 family protein [Solirubrobacteraceae bacterium]|nr:nuclear transport factor 2 family protein [Solirubrobacteraceae bacterium]